MSTTAAKPQAIEMPPAPLPASIGLDRWVCIPATWEIYEQLLEERGERGRPKYTFLDGRLTVVSPSHSHESLKRRISSLIEHIALIFSIDLHMSGQTTLKKRTRSKEGNEADESYYLTNLELVHQKDELVMGQDPPPDLVVEVVISNPEHDAVEAYRRMGVREIWICKPPGLEFLVLGGDGQYAPSASSACLPFFSSEELIPWIYRQDLASDIQIIKLFRTWVEETLVPRQRPA